jgi:hypothetical protein
MVCSSLDSGLRRLAADNACTYTRYADDITFSTTRKEFPVHIATVTVSADGKRVSSLGSGIRQVIEANSFKINEGKVRVRGTGQRMEVTGLIVQKGVNIPREFVRALRGLLHAWEKYGYEAAQTELRARHHRKHRRPGSPELKLLDVAAGKLEFVRMVRGSSDLMYTKLWNRFAKLAGSPYAPKVAFAQLPEQIDSALWILESVSPDDAEEIRYGTAFALEGYGFVTCAHCLGRAPIIAYQPGTVVQPRTVSVTHLCEDRDLARFELEGSTLTALRLGDDSSIEKGDATLAAGYGNYAAGSGSRLIKGHITGRGVRHGVAVLFSDHRAFGGNSGGPVLTPGLHVVGILQRASSFDAPGQETTVLPVSLLREVPKLPAPDSGAGGP